MEKLTLVQIGGKFESTVHSFSYTVFGGQITDKKLRSKLNAMNLLQNSLYLDCILLQKKHLLLLIFRRTQNFIIIIDQKK